MSPLRPSRRTLMAALAGVLAAAEDRLRFLRSKNTSWLRCSPYKASDTRIVRYGMTIKYVVIDAPREGE